jgi:general secretion pathway protein K
VQGFRLRPRPQRPSPEPGPDGERERGFVLIAAIWLLILAGSIAAILMLRSLAAATAAADRTEEVERRLALESATETLLADRLFNSQRSRWWQAPTEGAVMIGAREVRLRMTSESGRLDVNNADIELIASALRGLGVAKGDRDRIVQRLTALRTLKKGISSAAELDALIAGVATPPEICLGEELTFVSGLAEPNPNHMSAALSRALGGRGGARGDGAAAPVEGGAALRIEAREPGGAPLVSIVRLVGLPDRPLETSVWAMPSSCAARSAG